MPKALKPILDAALDMSRKARMERAREMGFDTDRVYYHGTAEDIDGFAPESKGLSNDNQASRAGYWLTDNPDHALFYANQSSRGLPQRPAERRQLARLNQALDRAEDKAARTGSASDNAKADAAFEAVDTYRQSMTDEAGPGQNIVPARLPRNMLDVDLAEVGDAGSLDVMLPLIKEAERDGYAGVVFRNSQDVEGIDAALLRQQGFDPGTVEGPISAGSHAVVFDPSNIRSVNATFDPAKRDSSNLLAGIGGAAVGAGLLAAPQESEAGIASMTLSPALRRNLDAVLDMSRSARMQRAREMGFDTDRVLFHGTKSDFDEFMPGGVLGSETSGHGTGGMGVWVTDTPDIANDFAGTYAFNRDGEVMAPKVLPLYSRAQNPKVYRLDEEYGRVLDEIRRLNGYLQSDEYLNARADLTAPLVQRFHDQTGEFQGLSPSDAADLFSRRWDEAERSLSEGASFRRQQLREQKIRLENEGRGLDPFRQFMRDIGYAPGRGFAQGDADAAADALWDEGFDAVEIRGTEFDAPAGERRNQTLLLNPRDIRSVNAAFDPAQRDSSNLLAGVGGAAVGAGLLAAPQESEAAPFGTLASQIGKRTREAFHGSPHIYDQVDLSRMGSGEGAQAYGAGYYAAEREGLATAYRKSLSPQARKFSTLDGNPVGRGTIRDGLPGDSFFQRASVQSALRNGNEKRFRAELAEQIETLRADAEIYSGRAQSYRDRPPVSSTYSADDLDDLAAMALARAEKLEAGAARIEFGETEPGALYRLEIPDEDLLDWDAPLSEQPERVRRLAGMEEPLDAALDRLGEQLIGGGWVSRADWGDLPADKRLAFARIMERQEGLQLPARVEMELRPNTATGENFYRSLSDDPGEASQILSEAGIPGIRYFDGMSRNAGEGTRNYVIFDDANVNVVERNGAPVAAMPRGRGYARPGMMAAAGATGAGAEFARRRADKRSPYRDMVGNMAQFLASTGEPTSVTALPDNVLTRAGQYLTETRPSEQDAIQRALTRTGQLQALGEYLIKTGQGDRTTALENAAAGLDISPI